jgi:hypothetical protein
MKTAYGGRQVEWLLDCEPRPAQLEGTLRSYYGYKFKDRWDDEGCVENLPHHGMPALGFGQFLQMRLGKTPLTLNEFMLFKQHYGVNKGFILSPNSYKADWAAEAERFGVDVPVHVFDAKRAAETDWFIRRNTEGIIVANYESLISPKSGVFLDWIDQKTYVAADESVKLKNPQSLVFKKSMLLSREASVTRVLTGLPNPQAITDFWAQLRFARKLSGTNFYSFRGRFATMGGYQGRKITGTKNEPEFEQLVSDCSFRASRKNWNMKIDSDYEIVNLGMTKDQAKIYDEMDKDFITMLDSGDMITADQVITKRIKMQQIASGFVYNEHKAPQTIIPFEKTPKFLDLKERLDSILTGKILIIGHYKHTMSELFRVLQPYGVACVFGNQDMKKMGRDVISEKSRFNNSDTCRIMLAQADAVKYGHTLMGTANDPCLTTCFFENSYNLDTRAQCEERNQGGGQQGSIHIFDYSSAAIEFEIIKALQYKENVANTVLGYYNKPTEKE